MHRLSTALMMPIVLGLLSLWVVACQGNVPTPEATATSAGVVTPEAFTPVPLVTSPPNPLEITPSNDTGMVIGSVISISTTLPLTETPVYLAEVFREGEEGAFVLNSAASPGSVTDSEGNFAHLNVKPGEYVLIVGDPYFEYEVVENPDTREAQTYFVEAGRVTQVGELRVPLQ